MTQESSGKERILGSFASLFSSALTASGETPEALKDSSSTLPRFISPSVADDVDCCAVPCLMLKHTSTSAQPTASLEDTAAFYLSRKLTLTRAELEAAPMALLENISESFMSLVDSRLRSSVKAIASQSEGNLVVGLLTSSTPIIQTAVVTSFQMLTENQAQEGSQQVAPLILEIVIDLSILNQLVTVTLTTPGTIRGTFGPTDSDSMLTNVEIALDTVALLQSMMTQARSATSQALVIASGLASNLLASSANSGSSSATFQQQPLSEAPNGGGGGASSSMMPPPAWIHPGQSNGISSHAPHQIPQGQGPTNLSSHVHHQTRPDGKDENGLSLLTAAAIGCERESNQDQKQGNMQHAS